MARSASQRSLTDIATATVTVQGLEDDPVAEDLSYTTNEDVPIAIALQCVDPDAGDVLGYNVVDPPGFGQLTGTAPALTYAPDADESGTDTFTYNCSDGRPGIFSNLATVTIVVRPIPDPLDAIDDLMNTTPEDTPITIDVLANDTDPDPGDVLTVSGFTQPSNGTVTRAIWRPITLPSTR